MTDPIETLKRLDAEMTAGPWRSEAVKAPSDGTVSHLVKYRWDDVPTWLAESSEHPNAVANIDGICALRNLIPAVIAEVERLRKVEAAVVRDRALPYKCQSDGI